MARSVPRLALSWLAARVDAQAGFATVSGQGQHPGRQLRVRGRVRVSI